MLYFDPAREAFILDRIDSTFNMNLTRLPTNSDPDSLSQKYPHIGSSQIPTNNTKTRKANESVNDSGLGIKKGLSQGLKRSPMIPPKKKHDKRTASKLDDFSLPKTSKTNQKPKHAKPDQEEDEDDEDDDDALLIEYPDGDPKSQTTDFSPAFPSVRRFDDFMDARESEGDDADGESEDEPDDLRLPSPVNHKPNALGEEVEAETENAMDLDEPDHEISHGNQAYDGGEGDEDEDDDVDLEKELENAFDDLENSNHGTPMREDHDESEISEED